MGGCPQTVGGRAPASPWVGGVTFRSLTLLTRVALKRGRRKVSRNRNANGGWRMVRTGCGTLEGLSDDPEWAGEPKAGFWSPNPHGSHRRV